MHQWYDVDRVAEIPSPALLVFPDRIEENIQRMIRMAGGPVNLRPHVKTHKISAVIRLKIKFGITRFKCSTIAEAEMVAQCGGKDIMLALQPVGPNIVRFFTLQKQYNGSNFSALVDDEAIVEQIASLAATNKLTTDLWLDINNGMDRTGVLPGEKAMHLYLKISRTPLIRARGLHVYDGHIHDRDILERRNTCERFFEPVADLIGSITDSGFAIPAVVAGGTPTFPIHVDRPHTETSPGTCVLWDAGYQENFPDLDFLPAAILMTRVISKPGKNLLCLDLGHKAIAAEMPHPRISFLSIAVNRFVNHSEEHLVIESTDADRFKTGDVLYGIPWHICPTVPRYKSVYTISDSKITGEWQVDARDRMIKL